MSVNENLYEMTIDTFFGDYKTIPVDYALCNAPDGCYDNVTSYRTKIEPLGRYESTRNFEEFFGLWIEQSLVASKSDLLWYKWKRQVEHSLHSALPFVHRVLRSAYSRDSYAYIADLKERPQGCEIHHTLPRNGLIALMWGDEIAMPMFYNGRFNPTTRDFFYQDDVWMGECGLLDNPTKQKHDEITEEQKTRHYTYDISINVLGRCDNYPKNPYYRFEDGQSYVNARHCIGKPRYSEVDWW